LDFVHNQCWVDGRVDYWQPARCEESAMASVIKIEGIGTEYSSRLRQKGVRTVEALLNAGASPYDRKQLAERSNIDESLILRWVNHADLFRIKGVGPQYAELLEAAGVDSVLELAQRRADHLTQKLADANLQRRRVRRVPTEAQVRRWIEQAQSLPRMVTY
jgi:predicted flap endonuclease-1-like 5' DNA nuclease